MSTSLISKRQARHLSASTQQMIEAARRRSESESFNLIGLQEEILGAAYLWRSDKQATQTMQWLLECIFAMSSARLRMIPYPSQVQGILTILSGRLAEMQTGEGKSLVAALSAATLAITGRSVHVATVNDYLAERDHEEFATLFSALKISHSLIIQAHSEQQRKTAYRQSIVYASGRELIFDHLRDSMEVGHRYSKAQTAIQKIVTDNPLRPVIGSFDCCIVDEADSVLIDEASTPCVISLPTDSVFSITELEAALQFAHQLDPPKDLIEITPGSYSLSNHGNQRLEEAIELNQYADHLIARELLRFAVTALYSLQRDHDYVVIDGKIGLVDKLTGRVSTERSYQTGLQQILELKEHLELSPTRDNAGRLTYQQFFKKYRSLSGMTGTAKEVRKELGSVYGLKTSVIAPHAKDAKRCISIHFCQTQQQKLDQILRETIEVHRLQQPILIGVDSVEFAQKIGLLLEKNNLSFQIVDGLNDDAEAGIIAQAGKGSAITVATPVAGRGTDIKIDSQARHSGGLHVLLTSLQFSKRIDRQFIGRTGRQGDPGSYSIIISNEDAVWKNSKLATVRSVLPDYLKLWLINWIQSRNERASQKYRKKLVMQEAKRMQQMAFRKKR